MMAIVFAALVGGPVTAALLWHHGPLIALARAPLGGSAAALVVATVIGLVRASLGRKSNAAWVWRNSAHPSSE